MLSHGENMNQGNAWEKLFLEVLQEWPAYQKRTDVHHVYGNLTAHDLQILERIGECTRKKMSDLARGLGVSPGSLTVAVSRLENKGYLIRKRGVGDSRMMFLSLTKEGREVVSLRKERISLLLAAIASGEDEHYGMALERFFSRFLMLIREMES